MKIRLLKLLSIGLAFLLVTTTVNADKISLVEFKDVSVKNAARILSTMSNTNIVVTREASDATVDLRLQNVELDHAVEMISRVSGLWYRHNKNNNSYLIMTEQQYQDDIVVYRDDIIRSFTLKHQNVRAAALTIQSLFGDRVILKLQDDRDDFEGIPSNYLSSITEQTSTSSNPGSNNNRNSRVTINNNGNNSGEANETSNLNYSSEATGEVRTVTTEEDETGIAFSSKLNDKLSSAQLRQTKQGQIDADTTGKSLGITTPIFIATNRIHNLLFVRTSDRQAMDEIEDLIRTSDKPTPQVLLETKIIRITESDSFTQDFDLSYNDALNIPGAQYQNGTTLNQIANNTATINVDDGTTLGNLERIRTQLSGGSVTGLGFNATRGGFYEFYSKYINAKVEFLEENNVAETIAKPILLASNNRPSRLFMGEDQVIAVGISAGSTTATSVGDSAVTNTTDTALQTEVRKIGNTLVLLPSVNEDGTVTIDILQSTSELKKQGVDFPFFNPETGAIESIRLDTVEESTLKTIVVAKDGNTIALGGMITQVDRDERSTVPVIGEIPLLGQLFNKKNTVESDAQYIMLITPHVIATPEQGREKTLELSELDYEKYDDSNQPSNNKYKMQDLIHLNRYAANTVNGNASYDPNIKLSAAPNANLDQLADNPALHYEVVSSHTLNNLFLTTIKVTNLSDSFQALAIKGLPGKWVSVSRETSGLPAFNVSEGAPQQSFLYFASTKPFAEALKNK